MQSDESNGCGGTPGTRLISAIPNDSNILPTFILDSNSGELTYRFIVVKSDSSNTKRWKDQANKILLTIIISDLIADNVILKISQ